MTKIKTQKAIDNIDNIIKLGEEIANAAPYLIRLKNTFQVIDICNDPFNPINADFVNSLIPVVDGFANLNVGSFNHSVATGYTAVIITNSSDYLITHDNIDQATLNVLEDIKNAALPPNIEQALEEIFNVIDDRLSANYQAAVKTYSQWKSNIKSNSDVAKDLRIVIEGLKGHLKILAGQEKRKEVSWIKIFEIIGIQSASNRKALLIQKGIYENMHDELTKIMKKKIVVDKERIKILYKDVNDHIYSVLNLVEKKFYIKD